jgi:hypothetical protein
MKKLFPFALLITLMIFSCKNEQSDKKTEKTEIAESIFTSYGNKISSDKALTSAQMMTKFSALKAGDTIQVKFASNIKEVCSKKGCWMKLPLNETTETMVRFKDYGFFMPLDSNGKEVIVAGKAFVKETSVKELQHYAEDAGKSKEEIAKIIAPKKEFAFEANGVLLKAK